MVSLGLALEPSKHFVHTSADLASRLGLAPEIFRQRRQEFMELSSPKELKKRVEQLVAVEEDKLREVAELPTEKRHLVERVRRWDLALQVSVMELELLRNRGNQDTDDSLSADKDLDTSAEQDSWR